MLKRLTLAAMLSLGVATGALAAGERHGGTLVFTAPYGSSFATLDVQSSPNTQEEFITQAIHRALYSWDSIQNKPVLELATSEDVSDDGTVHTYHLRKNAVFHNGKPMTPADVVFSLKRQQDPANAGFYSGVLGDLISRLVDEKQYPEGESFKVMILSAPDSPDTMKLPQPIPNDMKSESGKVTAFTMGQRYVSSQSLLKAKTTSDLTT